MSKFGDIEAQCLEDLRLDYTPLHDIVRIFSGFEKLLPTEDEFLLALELLEYMINKHNVITYKGPGGPIINQPTTELMQWLKMMWYSGKYNEINYGIWFEKKDRSN
jgi:hypothetical protein